MRNIINKQIDFEGLLFMKKSSAIETIHALRTRLYDISGSNNFEIAKQDVLEYKKFYNKCVKEFGESDANTLFIGAIMDSGRSLVNVWTSNIFKDSRALKFIKEYNEIHKKVLDSVSAERLTFRILKDVLLKELGYKAHHFMGDSINLNDEVFAMELSVSYLKHLKHNLE